MVDKSPDIRSAVWALRETETGWEPGSRFAYSDAGYQILTLVLEAVYAQPFADIIRTHLFKPLGMASSEPVLVHAIRPQLAKGYRHLYDDRPYHSSHPLVPTTWIEVSSGDCSIACTVEDLAKFGQFLLNKGAGQQGQVLSSTSYDQMVQLHSAADWCDYGYGIMLRRYDDFQHLTHGGGMPGYAAELMVDVDNGVGLALLSTTPRLSGLFWSMMSFWRALYLGHALDGVELKNHDPLVIPNATEYAGIYQSQAKTLVIIAEQDRLFLKHAGRQIRLESRDGDRFYVNHPDFDKFLLQFERADSAGNAAGAVVEVIHGATWYMKDAYIDQAEFAYPATWEIYPGHYRSHNPWQTNFRVILRKGKLLLVWPEGDEELLLPHRDHEFYVGERGVPERLHFSQFVNGQALCAIYAHCEYYRFFVA